MKKLNLLLLLVAMSLSISLQARTLVVNSTSTLQTAFNGAQDLDTISIVPGTYNVGKNLKIPPTGLIVLQSANIDSMAILQMEMQVSANVEDDAYTKKPSIIFNGLHLQNRYENYAAGAYIITLNGFFFSLDTLAFRNCEISTIGRCLFRSGAPSDRLSSGEIEWLEMSNCKVHDSNNSSNIWPLIYSAHIPMYVHFMNNTFYDMPYAKSIYQLNHMTNETGRNAEINFENNTVANTFARTDGIIATGSYLGEEAIFNINNNMFLSPNWSNEKNLSPDSAAYQIPPIIKCVGGIITAKNNVVDSMAHWLSGQILDEDGQGGFLVIDTLNTKKMKDLDFSWNDFVDPSGNDFSYLSTKQMATAGTDGGPIGDPRWVRTFITPRTLNVSANIEDAIVTPRRAYYEDGASATVTASTVDGYKFMGWKDTNETSISTENPYTFTMSSDKTLIADYSVLVVRNVAITISGSNSASYTITPQKDIYYEGDEITIALNNHNINDFEGWSDNNKDYIRTITLTGGDLVLTASFTEHPYILEWDFDQLTANNQTYSDLAANHAISSENPGIMNYVMTDTIRTISTRNNKFTTEGKMQINCLARRTNEANFGNPDYVFIGFSTKGLSNIKVKSMIATDNSIFPVQKMQYSFSAKTGYVDFATDTISGDFNQNWSELNGVLPVAAEDKDSVYVRWIADNSEYLADPTTEHRLFIPDLFESNTEYVYISNIIVINSNFTALNNLTSNDTYKIYSSADKLFVKALTNGKAEVYSIMGQKIKAAVVNTGLNEFNGLKSGVYIVKVGKTIQKVIIR